MRKYLKMVAATLIAVNMTACSDSDSLTENPPGGTDETTPQEAFVLATSLPDGEQTANVLLTSQTLTKGSVSAVNNGLMNDAATERCVHSDK